MADSTPFSRLVTRMTAAQAGGSAVPVSENPGMASSGLARAVVLGEGGGAPGWARALAGLASEVVWLVPDEDDASRLGEMLAQQVARTGRAPGFTLGADPGAARGADLLILADAAPALAVAIEPMLAPGAVVVAAGDRAMLMAQSEALARPEFLVGVHLPPPASLTTLAEILPGPATGRVARERALALVAQMRRIAVALPAGLDCPSLALIGRLWEEADALLLTGATPWEMDEALAAAHWPSPGPCLRQDLAGLDVACALRRRHARLTGRPVAPIAPRMLAEGRLGLRGGVGWYRYPGGGGPVIDPLMEDMCAEEAHFAALARRVVSDDEVVARLTLAVIDEAAMLATETGQALPDMVALCGLGFPRGAGGPLMLARALGSSALAAPLATLAGEYPARWAGTAERLLRFIA